jgi:hypothetical protein
MVQWLLGVKRMVIRAGYPAAALQRGMVAL